MKAKDVLPGDVCTDGNGQWMVRDIKTKSSYVSLLLSAGRTDPGEWSEYIDKKVELDIYRSPYPPLQHD